MARKKFTTEYYDIGKRQVKRYPDAQYHIAYGERDDGKSYGAKILAKECVQEGKTFVYIRRLHRHIVRKNMIKLFDDVQDKINKDLGSPFIYDTQKGFYINVDGEQKIVGFVTSLEDTMLVKSIPIVNVGLIIFDEFIDYSYMDNEITMFLHAMSTICRGANENVKIVMLGNTIHKDCPYFKLFGIDTRKVKQGEVYYLKHNLGVSATFEHTPTKVEDTRTKRKTNKYIGFDDNESVNMIMFGEWEYQHCNTKQLDGITWNCMRHFIPIYLTTLNQVYEFTINTDLKVPIAFVRKVNIQLGKCSTKVKYNLSLDNTVQLVSKNGFVPTISKINSLVDTATRNKWEKMLLCLDCGRVIFDDIATGSDIMRILKRGVG